MTGTQSSRSTAVIVHEVGWDDREASALRDAMTAEVSPRYDDRTASMQPSDAAR